MATTRGDVHPVRNAGAPRLRARSSIGLAFAVICLSSAQGSPACGQELLEEVYSSSLAAENSPEVRDRLFAELARDVAAMEQRLSIIKRVIQLVSPSVVHVQAKKNASYGNSYSTADSIEEAGSGVLISLGEKAYILTNRHVIRDAKVGDIEIQLNDGRMLRPTKVWEDIATLSNRTQEWTDVAVMAIPDVGDLVPARLGNSSQVEIGDFVLAVGSPFGLSQSVTYGIVSAAGRYNLDLGDGEVKYQNFLQTDAAINPGNSGGPLINLRGEVIGLNTAIASSSGGNEGIGFSIPINTAVLIARQLVEHGRVARAYLGVHLDMEYSEAAARLAADGFRYVQGARVSSINDQSPAAGVDIRKDDIIIAFDGTRIKDGDHLINVVGLTEVGREVDVVLLRDGQWQTVRVRVGAKTVGGQR
jgi:serine protease Do